MASGQEKPSFCTEPLLQLPGRVVLVTMVEWGFEHRTSSPRHQQANGQAESVVKAAKSILRKAKKSKGDPYLAILAARNTLTEQKHIIRSI